MPRGHVGPGVFQLVFEREAFGRGPLARLFALELAPGAVGRRLAIGRGTPARRRRVLLALELFVAVLVVGRAPLLQRLWRAPARGGAPCGRARWGRRGVDGPWAIPR